MRCLSEVPLCFDELKQSVHDVEFLADPTVGELRIGCPESITATVLPHFIAQFAGNHPQVIVRVYDVPSPAIKNLGLRDRKYDLVLARLGLPGTDDHTTEDLNLTVLFDDPLVIVAGQHSPWARRRSIDSAELSDEPWLLSPPDTWNYIGVAEAFRKKGLEMPTARLIGFSLHLATHFVGRGPFITAYPRSVARLGSLAALRVNMPSRPWPVVIATLKNRTSSPVAERFIESAREVAKSIIDRPQFRRR